MADCRAEMTDIVDAMEGRQVDDMGHHRWFKDQADLEQWKEVIVNVEKCEATGESFLVRFH